MLKRLWLLFSLAWAALFFWNATTRTVFSFDRLDAVLVFGPLALGIIVPALFRYVVSGSFRPLRRSRVISPHPFNREGW